MSAVIEPATSNRGMVATSHPLAVDAALDVMRDGGTSVDAAVAAGAMLTVVDPRSTGIGGDVFAQCWTPGDEEPVALAAAGPAPARMTPATLEERGFRSMPQDGPWSVTVPGGVAGWDALMKRYGRLDLNRVLQPAIEVAEAGFEVTPFIAADWSQSVEKLSANPYGKSLFLPDGHPPKAGQRFTNPDLAKSLRAVAESPATFYSGWIAEAIDDAMRQLDGPLSSGDLAAWDGPEWVRPMRASFRGLDVYELPPPNQGVVALQALKLYEELNPGGRVDEDHAGIECLKLAVSDAAAHVADPQFSRIDADALVSDRYLKGRRDLIDMGAAGIRSSGSPSADTVYVAVADTRGGACSFIQSIFAGFGSGVAVPGTGIVLQNRGAGFTLARGHPNSCDAGKRPFHTIIPAMLGELGRPRGVFGVVGGPLQPQGHFQVLRNMIDREMNPQAAVGEPRFRVGDGLHVWFESSYDAGVVGELASRGHIVSELSRSEAGGAQVIVCDADGFVGGSDPRKDGLARGY
jgi:gamma-glutamyltranspeptidase / glutathione hydrolase